MNRTHTVLGGLLVLQLFLIVLVRSPFGETHAAAPVRALLPELATEEVSRIELAGESDTVVLEHGDEGWDLSSDGGYPADGGRVDRLLDALKESEVRRPVVSSDRYHEALEVDPDRYKRVVRVWTDESGDSPVELYLGTSPSYRVTHARRGDEEQVFAVSGLGLADAPASASSWIDSRFMDIRLDGVTALRVENASGRFELEKRDGEWIVLTPIERAGDGLDGTKVDSLARAAASLWIAGPAGRVEDAAYGLDEPAARVVLYVAEPPTKPAGEDGDDEEAGPGTVREETLLVGGPVESHGGQRYVARDGFAWVARVQEGSVASLLEKSLDDLLAEAD